MPFTCSLATTAPGDAQLTEQRSFDMDTAEQGLCLLLRAAQPSGNCKARAYLRSELSVSNCTKLLETVFLLWALTPVSGGGLGILT